MSPRHFSLPRKWTLWASDLTSAPEIRRPSIGSSLLGGEVVYVPKRPGEPDCTFADITKFASSRLGAESTIQRWRCAHVGENRTLARRAALGSGFNRASYAHLVSISRQEGDRIKDYDVRSFRKVPAQDQVRQGTRKILGPAPRADKVIMCHGVFDIVHPGHVRHLLYAKSKANVLIASLTADRHIDKGMYRPHVPQDLRALNLAAFEMIDYVVVDENATPLEESARYSTGLLCQGLRIDRQRRAAPATHEELGRRPGLWRRTSIYTGRHRLFVERADQPRPAGAEAGKASDADERGKVTFDMLRGTLDRRRQACPCGWRHDRRLLDLWHHDRRPNQDADHERAVRKENGLRRRRGDCCRAHESGRR